MTIHDIRWIQRLQNYKKGLQQLIEATRLKDERGLSNLKMQGLIQAFEFTHELAWKTLKDFLQSRGNVEIYGSKDATRAAFKNELITQGATWMEMIESRNITSHTYDEVIADKISESIHHSYLPEFIALLEKLEELAQQEGDV